jgi:hypothetical protein
VRQNELGVWRDVEIISDKSAQIFLIFPGICPNFHGSLNDFFGEGQLPPVLSAYHKAISM